MMKGAAISRSLSCLTAALFLSACPTPGPIIDPPPNPDLLPPHGTSAPSCCTTSVAPIFGQTPSASIILDPGRIRPTAADLAPPNDGDVRSMARLLETIADPERAPAAIAALAGGEPFSLPRFSIVLEDVRSVLIGLHARESLDILGNTPGVPDDLRAWMESSFQSMMLCPPTRFSDRGGIDAYQSTLSIVQSHRRNLEPFLFQAQRDPRGRFFGPEAPALDVQTGDETQ